MAKKQHLTVEESREQATLEANVVAEEKSERAALDASVQRVFAAPVLKVEPVETPEAVFVREATGVLEVVRAGNAVSPGELVRLVNVAVGLLGK